MTVHRVARVLLPALAFCGTGYALDVARSAYDVFVLGKFEEKFGPRMHFEIELKALALVWSFHVIAFLATRGVLRLAAQEGELRTNLTRSDTASTGVSLASASLTAVCLSLLQASRVMIDQPLASGLGLLAGVFGGLGFELTLWMRSKWKTHRLAA